MKGQTLAGVAHNFPFSFVPSIELLCFKRALSFNAYRNIVRFFDTTGAKTAD